ncbi:hypothetical protein QU593_10345 [Rossellomorea marisflavi]|uniref:hypothetical protein n=1 Tax=Rossellomorea marisflavi TaxID=189381 RepID=UPI0025B0F532|nr:hypothetical protein [Rossellomorea marisflavi]WJV20805.1 hypothetical protein QU593_10345 [Rossellomorea marisflavi]
MSRLFNTFEFIGAVQIPKNKEKFLDVRESASGWVGHRLNFGVQQSKTNSVFVEMYGGYSKSKQNKVYSFSKGTENEKGTKLEIPWEDRLKEETLNMVADFKKIVIDFETDPAVKEKVNQLRYEIRSLEYKDTLTEDERQKLNDLIKEVKEIAVNRKEFVHEYDAVKYLSENLETMKNHKLRLTGSVENNYHNGKFYRKFKPELIEVAAEDATPKLRALMDVFFTKDAIDEADFKEEKKVYVNGHVLCYDSKEKKDMFFPQQLVLNAQKVDFENEMHVKRFNFLKNKFDVKGKGVYHLQWEVSIFRGADKVEFTYDKLTQDQKESVDFGLNTVSDFEPKGGFLGENMEETRLIKPVLQQVNEHNDFREGAVESAYELDELDYVPTQQSNTPPSAPETKAEEKIDIDAALDNLFD